MAVALIHPLSRYRGPSGTGPAVGQKTIDTVASPRLYTYVSLVTAQTAQTSRGQHRHGKAVSAN